MRGDLATWCRIFAVGPPCGVACPDCRARPITMSTIRALTAQEDPMDDDALSDPDRSGALTPPADPAHLITLGLTDSQRNVDLGGEFARTDVLVDLREETTPDQYLLQVVDAAELAPDVVLLVGPLVFGWVCSGQYTDLRDWSNIRGASVRIAVAVDLDDAETRGMASEVYTRLGAVVGLALTFPGALDWLRSQTQTAPA